MKLHKTMVRTPALPELHRIASECGGYVTEKSDFSNRWPSRGTYVGARRGALVLVAEGWDGDKIYAVVASTQTGE
jgi:hypothetical protein